MISYKTGADRWEEAKAAFAKALEIDPTDEGRVRGSSNALRWTSSSSSSSSSGGGSSKPLSKEKLEELDQAAEAADARLR